MKILLLSPLPPPAGGIASWTVNILSYFKTEQCNFELIHQNTAIKYRNTTNYKSSARLIWGAFELVRILRGFFFNLRKKPDVIHVTSHASFSLVKDFFLLKISKLIGVPIVFHWRFGRIPEIKKLNNWEWKLLKLIVRSANFNIVLDKKTFKTLQSEGFRNIYNIPNPISQELQKEASNSKSFKTIQSSRNIGTVIFVGYVIKNKGVYELIEACGTIDEIKELIIIGPYIEEDRKEIELFASQFEKKNWLKLTGHLNNEGVLSHMRTSHILALPSYTEGFPNVIIEGMIMGPVIIASKVGAIPEILSIDDGKPCGICVEPKSATELKDAILKILNDRVLAENLRNNAINKVLNTYTIKKVVDQYFDVWSKILKDTLC